MVNRFNNNILEIITEIAVWILIIVLIILNYFKCSYYYF